MFILIYSTYGCVLTELIYHTKKGIKPSSFFIFQVKLGCLGYSRLRMVPGLVQHNWEGPGQVRLHVLNPITPFYDLPNAYIPSIRTSVNNMTRLQSRKDVTTKAAIRAYEAHTRVYSVSDLSALLHERLVRDDHFVRECGENTPTVQECMEMYQMTECFALLQLALESAEHLVEGGFLTLEEKQELTIASNAVCGKLVKQHPVIQAAHAKFEQNPE